MSTRIPTARLTDIRQELPYEAWKDTMETLHMELQVIGKLRLALSPFEPQWANVALYLTAHGLTTSPLSTSDVTFDVEVDLIEHQVRIRTTGGSSQRVPLEPRPVAAFYRDFMAALAALGISVKISPVPSEVSNPIPFSDDDKHVAYDAAWANRFFRVLSAVDLVLKRHRAGFRGKTSPVNFFWGTFDLVLARYSGRAAEAPPGAGIIARRGGNAEVICVGFWPGNAAVPWPAFFGYAYPKPVGMEQQPIRPAGAQWSSSAGEFLLPYDEVRRSASPQDAILEFCESVYSAGAQLGGWDPSLVIAR